MRQRNRRFVLGGLWLVGAALQVYHLHTGEMGWAWSTALALLASVFGSCYYFGAGLKSTE